MNTHILKTDPNLFQLNWDSQKVFDVRLNDRNFQKSDVMWLAETLHTAKQMQEEGMPLIYTGRKLKTYVKYVMTAEEAPGGCLKEGYCIIALGPMEQHHEPADYPPTTK